MNTHDQGLAAEYVPSPRERVRKQWPATKPPTDEKAERWKDAR
jgi:hypothetical protein